MRRILVIGESFGLTVVDRNVRLVRLVINLRLLRP